ncbi:uncharacterized protein LOC130715485 isoform X1 [Lotus japonicus]|uniref:uncharacterized protein LOC130715485 isoform X1 n=1 Tax=Lotus japonicus TaxID=34305 RepID=UPI0025873CE4|nr:uncharacterized protein LOC130715485 isoform X1 [Lotus japonicus]
MAIDQKESLHLNRKTLSLLSKFCSGKAKENATASSSHSMSTPVLEVVNESEQEEQPELLLSAPNDSMTSLEKSSTNGIDANAATHKIKEVIVRGNLTVTVISAENLPALDFMRKSDPYVVLTLRKAKSKVETICQTKVVNNCLNPSWNQAFDFVVEDGLHDELIVEVWDHDTIGKDDFMGRCTLSLKRVIHEEEYEGRFKLVCAERFGAESSYLKLHLKWMHQPTHSDSNFLPSFSNDLELKPVGILKVKLMQAKELTNGHTFRKPDLFVVLHMQASGETGKESETIVERSIIESNFICIVGSFGVDAADCAMLNVYAPCDRVGKRQLWSRLVELKINIHYDLWCVAGDFIVVRSSSERRGVGANSQQHRSESVEFNDFIDEMELLDIPLLGRKFTWVRPNGLQMSRLDRFLISPGWLNRWPDYVQEVLQRDISDHCPLLFKRVNQNWGPKPFRVVNCWFDDPRFQAFVGDSWREIQVEGRGIIALKEKLKTLKLKLK